MKHGRYAHTCGVAGNYIVVIGGSTDLGFKDTIEIFNIETGEWTYGPKVPDGVFLLDARTAPFGDSFLLTGGRDEEHTSLGTIYEFDPVTTTLKLREERIVKKNYSHVAMTAPPEMYPCSKKYISRRCHDFPFSL